MIAFCDKPIPVVTPLGDGYVIYIRSNGQFENDEWCVAMEEDGQVRHFLSNDIKIFHNETYNIKKNAENFTDYLKSTIPRFGTVTNSTAGKD